MENKLKSTTGTTQPTTSSKNANYGSNNKTAIPTTILRQYKPKSYKMKTNFAKATTRTATTSSLTSSQQ